MRPRETRLNAFDPNVAAPPSKETDEPAARTVGEVVADVNRFLMRDMFDVWVKGELSAPTEAVSGHWYFDLKDGRALLKGVLFASDAARLKFRLEAGMDVLVRGRVSVYPDRAVLQIMAKEVRPVGQGSLALAYEQLKRRLAAEGLFDPARKRRLPTYPRRIGVVTSRNAAAFRDIIHVATRRDPGVRITLCDARVQGQGAADEIAAAIARLNGADVCDVIIVGRGGGSAEDLWAFNEEAVVRAVATSRLPVVSAVGHETDVSLCDLAADHRAATPSAAAETLVSDATELLTWIDEREKRLEGALRRFVPDMRRRVDDFTERLGNAMRRFLAKEKDLLTHRAARLDSLSPLRVLSRGYAVVQREGHIVRTAADAPVGTQVDIIVQEARLRATVQSVKENSHARTETR